MILKIDDIIAPDSYWLLFRINFNYNFYKNLIKLLLENIVFIL